MIFSNVDKDGKLIKYKGTAVVNLRILNNFLRIEQNRAECPDTGGEIMWLVLSQSV